MTEIKRIVQKFIDRDMWEILEDRLVDAWQQEYGNDSWDKFEEELRSFEVIIKEKE